MNLELVSFKLCPFVQRSVITLLHRQVRYSITYIDLNNRPDWFMRISPFGQVPVLKVDQDTILFESAVINEFIDEATPGESMQPADPLARALNRAWVEFGSACIMDSHAVITAADEDSVADAVDALHGRFVKLEPVLVHEPFFNGESLSLLDTAFAPLFMRLEILNRYRAIYRPEEFPRIAAWSRKLLALPEVRQSVVPEFEDLYLKFVSAKEGYMAGLLG